MARKGDIARKDLYPVYSTVYRDGKRGICRDGKWEEDRSDNRHGNQRRDIVRAAIAIIIVCVFMAFASGCEDKEADAALPEIVVVNVDTGEQFTVTEDVTFEYEGDFSFHIADYTECVDLTIVTATGAELKLTIGDKIDITGDADMTGGCESLFL